MAWLYFFHIVKEQNSPGLKNQNQANTTFAWF
jgi:hypothetical protein